jgi:hypothetical protein
MKKMNETYEAPVAEMFEMQMPTVLMASINGAIVDDDGGMGGDLPFGA